MIVTLSILADVLIVGATLTVVASLIWNAIINHRKSTSAPTLPTDYRRAICSGRRFVGKKFAGRQDR